MLHILRIVTLADSTENISLQAHWRSGSPFSCSFLRIATKLCDSHMIFPVRYQKFCHLNYDLLKYSFGKKPYLSMFTLLKGYHKPTILISLEIDIFYILLFWISCDIAGDLKEIWPFPRCLYSSTSFFLRLDIGCTENIRGKKPEYAVFYFDIFSASLHTIIYHTKFLSSLLFTFDRHLKE